MLRAKELRAARRFHRIAGIRTHGHFDHDASNVTGPQHPSRTEPSVASAPEPGEDLLLVVEVDEETGEPILKINRD